ncbi:MAG TPA: NAD-dependent succinate-semialdehyde dehydrogenase [Paracoccus sp. (in: a-proteobacteria)]|uniref:NAD-dependent succinate-semialdehyde dehydrogenase n=1 Tax=Paracoccus sp. TaxID=267 RepID=UPI002BEB39E2|nr:NAD-dependent succinate-semialdehyde dehydrogenase [Paracoccus sp. (in: a-proteobacteria)]HWL58886.1 NAD-dependent succinate-semialdehyde dehydrogenase [Paracoccus sp. (in: a-proteobacteria)]
MSYPTPMMFIAGEWCPASDGASQPVLNPATQEVIGHVPLATADDLDRAVEAAVRGFAVWRKVGAFDRYKIMRKAGELLRERAPAIARNLTIEQGKPLAEAMVETLSCADVIDWFAEEGRRNYGRIVPPRASNIHQQVIREPVGPVAAFTPWNFPLNQAVRKISAALAAGCSVVIKAPEETPASPMALIQAFVDAGVPGDVLSLVFGEPAMVSNHLIPHPDIRKISFTGSTAIGKELSALAGRHMKRSTMELGGHAPAIVFADADVDQAAKLLSMSKFRNAGQVCVSPTRFLVHENVMDQFLDRFQTAAAALKVGDGLEDGVTMGPLAHARRLSAMEEIVGDAREKGAEIRLGGARHGNKGYFFQPTVMTSVPEDARILHEEPFGPIAPMIPFRDEEALMTEVNRLPYGLAAYAFTAAAETRAMLADRVEAGMLTINHLGLALPEVPFGGIKDSGYGSEGGTEALDAYVNTKFVTQTV